MFTGLQGGAQSTGSLFVKRVTVDDRYSPHGRHQHQWGVSGVTDVTVTDAGHRCTLNTRPRREVSSRGPVSRDLSRTCWVCPLPPHRVGAPEGETGWKEEAGGQFSLLVPSGTRVHTHMHTFHTPGQFLFPWFRLLPGN